MSKNQIKYISIILIALVLFTRLFNDIPNFTPVLPVILIFALYFKSIKYMFVPILAIFISDIFLAYYLGGIYVEYLSLTFINNSIDFHISSSCMLNYLMYLMIYFLMLFIPLEQEGNLSFEDVFGASLYSSIICNIAF